MNDLPFFDSHKLRNTDSFRFRHMIMRSLALLVCFAPRKAVGVQEALFAPMVVSNSATRVG